jgi:hypothetical protein
MAKDVPPFRLSIVTFDADFTMDTDEELNAFFMGMHSSDRASFRPYGKNPFHRKGDAFHLAVGA